MAISHGRASTILPCLLQHPGKTWQLKQASLEFKLQHIGSCFWMECKWYVFEVIWVYHTMGNSPKSCNFNFDHTAVVVSHISSFLVMELPCRPPLRLDTSSKAWIACWVIVLAKLSKLMEKTTAVPVCSEWEFQILKRKQTSPEIRQWVLGRNNVPATFLV